jgi:hypothetical protein
MAAPLSNTSNTEVMHSVGKRRYLVGGTFFPNGSSAIVAASNTGTAGWTVAYTSTGLYTVTLDRQWLYIVSKSFGFAMSAATAVFPQWGTISLSNGTLQIRSINGSGVLTDIAANAANSISFQLVVSNDTVTG